MEPYNIKYVITGKTDGRWVVQAFDHDDKPIGVSISVATPSDAWKIYMMLNGYHYASYCYILPEKVA